MFKLIIAGGRDFDDYDLMVKGWLDYLVENSINVTDVEIISGGAKGADRLGERLSKEIENKFRIFLANWNLYGKSAGYKRNAEMANYADGALIFWDGKSKGSKHMIDLADSKGLKTKVVMYSK